MRIAIHVKPGSRVTRVGGSSGGSLAVRVRVRAVDGKANAAAVEAVAEAFGLRPRQVTLIYGRAGQRKLLELDIDEVAGRRRAEQLRGAATGNIPAS
jgi:uncharacterized protein YggU (UPF0235/DUF167 family)